MSAKLHRGSPRASVVSALPGTGTQVKAEDEVGNEVTLELSQKFAEHIDAMAQKRGFTKGDDYVAQWKWTRWGRRPTSTSRWR